MNQPDYAEFKTALRLTAEGYLIELTPPQIAAYWAALEPYDLDAVKAALRAAPRTSPTFFPKVGELIGIIEGSAEDRAAVAWRTLLEIVARGGWPSLQITDGALAFAIIEMGGYSMITSKLHECSAPMEASYLKQFSALYRIGLTRNAPPQYLVGEIEARNRTLGSWITIRDGRQVEAFELPTPVCLVGTEKIVEMSMPLDLRTQQLTADARAALAGDAEAIRRYLPAPVAKALPAGPIPAEERATPKQIAEIQDAVAALAGGRRLVRRELGPAIEPTKSEQIQ